MNNHTPRKVAVVITCMDCRLHHPDAQHYTQLCDLLGVDDCYIETEAGPDGAVMKEHDSERWHGAVKNLVLIREAKKPDVFAFVAHYDCAGHPVSDAQHDQDVQTAARGLSDALFAEPHKVTPIIAYPNPDADATPTWLLKRVDTTAA